MKWHIVSPIPVKRRVRFRRSNGATYVDPNTKADMRRIADSWDGGMFHHDEPLALVVDVFQQLPESRARFIVEPFIIKPDIDNIVKVVMDGLNGTAFVDDKQIVFVSCHKHNRTNDIKGEYIRYALLPVEELRKLE